MSNYLSKYNRIIIESILPLLKKDKTKEVILNVNDPHKLEYILRGAYKKAEYSWIKDTYIISIEGKKLILKPRQLSISVEEEAETEDIIEAGDFFEIINHLISRDSKTNSLYIFHCENLTENGLEAIDNWCKVNGYTSSFSLSNNILRIKNDSR